VEHTKFVSISFRLLLLKACFSVVHQITGIVLEFTCACES